MILGLFTEEKREWSGPDTSPRCLSWHLHAKRADFDFRTNIYNGFPKSKRHSGDILLVPNKQYTIRCRIFVDKAEYYVDEVLYCSCKLQPGDVPTEGYPGIGRYNSESCLLQSMKVEPLSPDGQIIYTP